MNELLTYAEVLKQIENNKKYLLLGNGYSMAYDRNRFSFTSLLDRAVEKGVICKDSPIYKVFTEFDTKDFEEVVKLLETSAQVLDTYGFLSEENKAKVLSDSSELKKHLVEVITNNHPEKITDIPVASFLKNIKFIKEYERIYTLNYDLLLYWSCMKLKELAAGEYALEADDGFYDPHNHTTDYVTYGNEKHVAQNIFYMHGGLHIFDNKDEIIKNTFSRTERTLKEQTLENLNKNIYPIFVSEGTSKQKKAKIIHSAYLNHCFKSLSSIGGKSSLVIFGTLLKSNDEHIKEAILKNNVKSIYIGVSKIENANELDDFVDECGEKGKKVNFYDYKSTNIW